MPLKVFSQDAEVCLLHNIPREKTEQEEERRKWQLLRSMFCSGPGAVSGFPPEMPELRISKPLVLCF